MFCLWIHNFCQQLRRYVLLYHFSLWFWVRPLHLLYSVSESLSICRQVLLLVLSLALLAIFWALVYSFSKCSEPDTYCRWLNFYKDYVLVCFKEVIQDSLILPKFDVVSVKSWALNVIYIQNYLLGRILLVPSASPSIQLDKVNMTLSLALSLSFKSQFAPRTFTLMEVC